MECLKKPDKTSSLSNCLNLYLVSTIVVQQFFSQCDFGVSTFMHSLVTLGGLQEILGPFAQSRICPTGQHNSNIHLSRVYVQSSFKDDLTTRISENMERYIEEISDELMIKWGDENVHHFCRREVNFLEARLCTPTFDKIFIILFRQK